MLVEVVWQCHGLQCAGCRQAPRPSNIHPVHTAAACVAPP
jgi:hypothetical protein